jgi:hypothetical protein
LATGKSTEKGQLRTAETRQPGQDRIAGTDYQEMRDRLAKTGRPLQVVLAGQPNQDRTT